MATAVVEGIVLAGTPALVTASARVEGIVLSGTPSTTGRTARIQGIVLAGTAVPTGISARIQGIILSGTIGVTVAPIAPQTVSAFSPVQLSAALATGAPAIVSWVWRQISGAGVTMTANSNVLSFEAPGTMAGGDLVFGVVAIDQRGNVSPEVQARVTVLPHTIAQFNGTTWVPLPLFGQS